MNKKTILAAIAIMASTSLVGFAAVSNNIVDVTDGKTIRSIVTSADAAGFAKVSYNSDGYNLHAEFVGLSDPKSDDFYEGWLVRKSPFAFISTGEAYKKDGKYHNRYSSDVDYRDYDFYVLTLEPNDGDDAPADHILEGNTIEVNEVTHPASHNKIDHEAKKSTHDKKTNTILKAKIEKTLSQFSSTKKAKLKKQVIALKAKLPKLDFSETKREKYQEIINLLLEVLK